MKVIRSSQHLFQLLGGLSWADLRCFSQDLDNPTFRYFPENTWHLSSRPLISGFTEWGLSKKIVRSSLYWHHLLQWSQRLFQEGFYQNSWDVSFRHILGKMHSVFLYFTSDLMASSLLSSSHQMVASRHWLMASRLGWSALRIHTSSSPARSSTVWLQVCGAFRFFNPCCPRKVICWSKV